MTYRCPSCRALVVPNRSKGRTVRCPACHVWSPWAAWISSGARTMGDTRSTGLKLIPAMLATLQARDPLTLTTAAVRPVTQNIVPSSLAPRGSSLFSTRNVLVAGAAGLAFVLWRRSKKR